MANRMYRPGTRKRQYAEGVLSKNRVAWLQTYVGQWVVMKYDETEILDDDTATPEPGPTIRLMLPTKSGRTLYFNITALTWDELKLLKELFDLLFRLAEPVVKMRDKAAQDAFDRGDDSFVRVYRQVPRLVVREGPLGADGQGVLDGPADDAPGDRGARGDAGRVRDDGDELADGEPSAGGAQDDEP